MTRFKKIIEIRYEKEAEGETKHGAVVKCDTTQ